MKSIAIKLFINEGLLSFYNKYIPLLANSTPKNCDVGYY